MSVTSGLMTLARTALCAAYKYSGALALHERLAHRAGREFMTILLFHRVTDLIPEDGLTVHPERFRRLCKLLARSFRVVPLGEIFRIVRARERMPRRTLAITFDDSYRDNLDAARVLADFALPATFFIPTAFVGTDRVFDWDRGLPRLPNLSWPDVREILRMGHEIGSHSVSHANLGAVTREQARSELFDSRRVLEDQLGRPVRWFAYPFGGRHHLRPEWLPLIDEAGYDGTLSAFGGFVTRGCDDRILPREAVPYFRSLLHLEMYLAGCLGWFYALKRRLGSRVLDRLTPYQYPRSQPAEALRHPVVSL